LSLTVTARSGGIGVKMVWTWDCANIGVDSVVYVNILEIKY